MNTALILVPAISGCWFLTHTHWTHSRFVRRTGYHILFGSAFCGALLYGISFAITDIAFKQWHPCVYESWASNSPPLFDTASQVSLLLALALPRVVNLFFREDDETRQSAERHGDNIELTLHDAHKRGQLVEVTLRSRKSYIGSPMDFGNGNNPDSDASIFPVFSGYRREDNQELRLTRDYRPVTVQTELPQEDSSGWRTSDFKIVFPMSEIMSVRLFNEDLFEAFGLLKPGETDKQIDPTRGQRAGTRRPRKKSRKSARRRSS